MRISRGTPRLVYGRAPLSLRTLEITTALLLLSATSEYGKHRYLLSVWKRTVVNCFFVCALLVSCDSPRIRRNVISSWHRRRTLNFSCCYPESYRRTWVPAASASFDSGLLCTQRAGYSIWNVLSRHITTAADSKMRKQGFR